MAKGGVIKAVIANATERPRFNKHNIIVLIVRVLTIVAVAAMWGETLLTGWIVFDPVGPTDAVVALGSDPKVRAGAAAMLCGQNLVRRVLISDSAARNFRRTRRPRSTSRATDPKPCYEACVCCSP